MKKNYDFKSFVQIEKKFQKQKFFLLNEPNILKNDSFLMNKWFFEKKLLKKGLFLILNKLSYWTNDFTEQTIILNKQFYWTIIQWKNEQNRWKMNNILE